MEFDDVLAKLANDHQQREHERHRAEALWREAELDAMQAIRRYVRSLEMSGRTEQRVELVRVDVTLQSAKSRFGRFSRQEVRHERIETKTAVGTGWFLYPRGWSTTEYPSNGRYGTVPGRQVELGVILDESSDELRAGVLLGSERWTTSSHDNRWPTDNSACVIAFRSHDLRGPDWTMTVNSSASNRVMLGLYPREPTVLERSPVGDVVQRHDPEELCRASFKSLVARLDDRLRSLGVPWAAEGSDAPESTDRGS